MNLRNYQRVLAPALIAAIFCLLGVRSYGQGKAILVEQGASHLMIDYYPGSYTPQMVKQNDKTYLFFQESELSNSPGTDALSLPHESFLIGIPPTGIVRLSVVSKESKQEPAEIAKMPDIRITDDAVPSVNRIFNQDATHSIFVASEIPVRIGRIGWFRYQRVAAIVVDPLQYDVGSKTVTKNLLIRIRVEFAEHNDQSSQPPDDPLFETEYRSAIVNYGQSLGWRADPTAKRLRVSESSIDSTESWFNPATDYVKVSIAEDGIYALRFEDVEGFIPAGVDTRTFDLFYKGKSLPFLIRGDQDGMFNSGDTIEFYGSRLYDAPATPNEFSDTSMYWLSLSGMGGTRTTVDSTVAGNPDVILSHFIETVHLEKDSFYYYGDFGLPTNNQSEKIFGEGWYWRRLLANQSTAIGIACTNPYVTGNPTYSVRGKLHSPVVQQSTPNHSVQVFLNGTSIGLIQFSGYSDTVFSLNASPSLFINGLNVIRLASNLTGAAINEVFVDWLEIEFLKNIVADSDLLSFTASEATAGQIFRAQISGFSVPDAEVFRIDPLGGVEKKFLGAVSGTTGNYSFTFTDTAQPMRKYVAVKPQAKKKPQRLRKKTFVNLRSPNQGADYLVVTGEELSFEANRLAQYRAQQGVGRSKVVFTDDIYDEFNFGHFDPNAIRRFLLSVDSLWVQPKPAYVVFLGDANWDYKNNLKTGRRNIVPSLGNPISDTWLVSSKDDRFLQTKKVGRIPASTKAQASSFVDMVIAYEGESLTSLNKRFMFMASGFDSLETLRFQQFSDQLISQNVSAAPISGVGVRIYKTVEQVIGAEQTEEAKKLIAEGAIWINFYGHAGTDIWGNGITSSEQLQNKEQKRHLVSDISCSTARFGEPLTEAFGEKLLFAPNGGSIAFIGSSGFGYESPLRFLASQMYTAVSADSIREVGGIHFKAKYALWQLGTSSILTREALQQFTLLGDPATRLAIARKPEYSVTSNDAIITPAQPSEADAQISISIPIANYGLKGKDSVRVRLVHSTLEGVQFSIDRIIPAIAYSDTVKVSDVSFRRSGSHRLQCIVDPAGAVDEVTKTNNAAEIAFFVGVVQSVAIRPHASSSVHPDSVLLVIQNPNLPQTSNYRAIFEVDTVPTFTSQGKIVQQGISQGMVTTQWRAPLNLLLEQRLYYWRARLTSNTDSTPWVEGYFVTESGSPVQWQQDRYQLFNTNQQTMVTVDSTVRLLSQRIPVEVYSGGFSDGNESIIYLDGRNVSQGFAGRGYNIAVLDKYSGNLKAFAAFSIYSDVPDTALAEPLIQFLQSIPNGETVLVGLADEGEHNKTERLNKAFESIGSAMIRSLGFRASWAIIGRKGASIGSVPESLRPSGSGPITLRDTLGFQSIQGEIISKPIGFASTWKEIGFTADTANGVTHVSLGVIRRRMDGTQDTLRNISLHPDSIRSFLPSSVSSLQLIAFLRSDSAGLTPHLRKWWVDFQPAADLAINYQTVKTLADSALEGVPVDVQATVFNIGDTNADSVLMMFGAIENNAVVVNSQSFLPTIGPGSSTTVTSKYMTAGKKGSYILFLQVDPLNRITEAQKSNNAFSIPYTILRDNTPPTFDFTVDGSKVFDGDYVSPNPSIMVSVFDNSALPITNPSDIIVRLDGRRVSLGSTPDSLFESRAGPEKAVAVVRPKLPKGEHLISVQVKDATGNFADTTEQQVRLKVETDSKVMNVFNFPNPFATETRFTFYIVGARIPDELIIKVFTLAGRLVQEVRVPQGDLRIGFNSVPWGGRDRDGDELANGVYFYKIIMKIDEKTEEVVQKLAKMR